MEPDMIKNALKILNEDPPEEALKRTRKGGGVAFYLEVGDTKAVMKDAFELAYSSTAQVTHLEVYDDPKFDKRTGEVAHEGWGAYAVAHCRVTIGYPGNPVSVREDVGTCEAQHQKSRGLAVALAAKGAQSDAFKRAVNSLGKRLGLGLRLDPRVDYERVDGDDDRLRGDDESASDLSVNFKDAPAGDQRQQAARETAEAMAETLSFYEASQRLGLDEQTLTDLNEWPERDPLTRDVLVAVDKAARQAVGKDQVARLWGELGVELRRGAVVTGEQAGQFVLRAGGLARSA